MSSLQLQSLWKNPTLLGSSSSFWHLTNTQARKTCSCEKFSISRELKYFNGSERGKFFYSKRKGRGIVCKGFLLPVDPWAPNIDSESVASQLFAFSLFPYLGFLYFITKSNSAPRLTLFGFYFLLVFVGATTKVHYGTSLSNVDWLHGGAESLLTLTNLFIVLGLREALRRSGEEKEKTPHVASRTKQQEKSSV